MSFIKKILIVLLFLPSMVYADCSENSCTNVLISRLYVTVNGNTVISTSGDESKLNCDAGNKGYIYLDPDSKNYSSTYSLLLAAHINAQRLWVRLSDSGACNLIYVVSDK